MSTNGLKVMFVGLSGVGKTTIERHFFLGLSFSEILDLKIGPTKEVFKFGKKPFKLGAMRIASVDTAGQSILRRKLHSLKFNKTWKNLDVCIYITDIAVEIANYEKNHKSETLKQKIKDRLKEVKEDLKSVIKSINKNNDSGNPVRLTILFHKWDLLDFLPAKKREKWRSDLENKIMLLSLSSDKKFSFLRGEEDDRISFYWFHPTSIKDSSCREAIRLTLPRQEHIKKTLNHFIELCKKEGAKMVYVSVLNIDGLPVEDVTTEDKAYTEKLYEAALRYCTPSLHLRNELNSEKQISFFLLQNPDRLLIIHIITHDLSVLCATDIVDLNKMEKIINEFNSIIHSTDEIIKVYYDDIK